MRLNKPLVAAIDHFAIGLGLQVALQADWRVASARASLSMPELRHGIGCPLGAVILEALLGRAAMVRLVVGCEALGAERALSVGLVDEVVGPDGLVEHALKKAAEFGAYPALPYRRTKQAQNARMIAQLEAARQLVIDVHIECLLARSSEAHFLNVLGRGPAGGAP